MEQIKFRGQKVDGSNEMEVPMGCIWGETIR